MWRATLALVLRDQFSDLGNEFVRKQVTAGVADAKIRAQRAGGGSR
jgi:hypothetical protein